MTQHYENGISRLKRKIEDTVKEAVNVANQKVGPYDYARVALEEIKTAVGRLKHSIQDF